MPVLADLFFGLQVVDFELVMNFGVMVFGCEGLDMRVCWIFLRAGESERKATEYSVPPRSARGFGLRSGLRQSGSRCAVRAGEAQG
jgi:hypothetical protein